MGSYRVSYNSLTHTLNPEAFIFCRFRRNLTMKIVRILILPIPTGLIRLLRIAALKQIYLDPGGNPVMDWCWVSTYCCAVVGWYQNSRSGVVASFKLHKLSRKAGIIWRKLFTLVYKRMHIKWIYSCRWLIVINGTLSFHSKRHWESKRYKHFQV